MGPDHPLFLVEYLFSFIQRISLCIIPTSIIKCVECVVK